MKFETSVTETDDLAEELLLDRLGVDWREEAELVSPELGTAKVDNGMLGDPLVLSILAFLGLEELLVTLAPLLFIGWGDVLEMGGLAELLALLELTELAELMVFSELTEPLELVEFGEVDLEGSADVEAFAGLAGLLEPAETAELTELTELRGL